MSASNVNILTMVWGDKHLDLFKKGCFRSLNWPKNKKALEGATWHIFTRKNHIKQIEEIFKGSGFPLGVFLIEDETLVPGCGRIRTGQLDAGVLLLDGLKREIHECLSNGKKMLLAPPDTIFGDGTIENLISLGAQHRVCVATPHPRVLPTILSEIDYLESVKQPIENPQLVSLAFDHLHASWEKAEIGVEGNSSYVGGVSWKRLSKNLYSVTHRLPTVYFADFIISDWDFWWGQVSFGSFDHIWPQHLVKDQRVRYAGSSDACFVVEITDADQNVPPLLPKEVPREGQPDSFFRTLVHNEFFRQTNVIFRGE